MQIKLFLKENKCADKTRGWVCCCCCCFYTTNCVFDFW